MLGPFRETIEMTNQRISNFMLEVEELAERVSLCEVYAQIESGDP